MPLYKRPGSSIWWVRIGRGTRRSTGTADKKQAQEYERTLKDRLWRADKLGDRGATSWHDTAERWLKDSRRARKRDRELLAWLEPKIGHHPVSSVSHPDVITKLREHGLATEWSHSTVDRLMRTVRAVLRFAKRERLIDDVVHVPMYGEPESAPRFLTREQFGRLHEELPPALKLAARFAVCTLLRLHSQSRLTWDHVDLKARTAWIKPQNMKGGARLWPHGFTCHLSDEAIEILREARQLIIEGPIFGQDDFNTAAFHKASRRAGLEGLRWHDLRHTGASWAVQSGVSLPQLMELGGWKTYRMVLRYARFAPSNTAQAAQLVGTNVAQSISAHKHEMP